MVDQGSQTVNKQTKGDACKSSQASCHAVLPSPLHPLSLATFEGGQPLSASRTGSCP